jgi:hypothetical protein
MWVPLKDKRKENDEVVKEILQFGKKHPEISKYVKSARYFKESIGGKPAERRVLITEFASLTEMDRFFRRLRKNKDWQKIAQKWSAVMNPNTVQSVLWNDQLRDLWIEK